MFMTDVAASNVDGNAHELQQAAECITDAAACTTLSCSSKPAVQTCQG